MNNNVVHVYVILSAGDNFNFLPGILLNFNYVSIVETGKFAKTF